MERFGLIVAMAAPGLVEELGTIWKKNVGKK